MSVYNSEIVRVNRQRNSALAFIHQSRWFETSGWDRRRRPRRTGPPPGGKQEIQQSSPVIKRKGTFSFILSLLRLNHIATFPWTAAISFGSHEMALHRRTLTQCWDTLSAWTYFLQDGQHPFDGGHQGVGTLEEVVVVEGLLLLRCLQSLLGVAQRALHLLQLPAQGFVGLLQLRFHLRVLLW